MKKVGLLILMVMTSILMFAQASATATIKGTIVQPVGISKTIDMDFGNMASSPVPGVVTLYPNSTRNISGGVTLPATSGTVTAATFIVTGFANTTYSITLPGSAILDNGTNHMTVQSFTSNPNSTGTLDGAGNSTLTVGADLLVGAAQATGVYLTTTPITITVNYN